MGEGVRAGLFGGPMATPWGLIRPQGPIHSHVWVAEGPTLTYRHDRGNVKMSADGLLISVKCCADVVYPTA